jgi:putative transposase
MANTYTQLYIQLVFAVKGKGSFIFEKNRVVLEKYICGIINNNNSKPLAIYCNPDHLHVLMGLHPNISVSDMTRDIKTNSSKFINENRWMAGKFQWQDGFGAFTYAKSQIDAVSKYILNQPEHHKKKTFKEEYLLMLQKFEIKYDEKYLFDWNEE